MWHWSTKTETFIEFFGYIRDFKGNDTEPSTENIHKLKFYTVLKSLQWEILNSMWKALRIVGDQIEYLLKLVAVYILISEGIGASTMYTKNPQ